jgi:hypothetical protein
MTYKISIADNRKYIIIEVHGKLTRENAMTYTLESHKLGAEIGVLRFLVDAVDARNAETVGENYDFAYKDVNETPEIERRARVALLVEPDDHSHDFVETLFINSGHNVRLFRDRQMAIDYLEK